jgi:hypothetical protein
MKGRICLAATSALALALLAACGGSSDDGTVLHSGSLRALHAIPELDVLTFTLDGEELVRFTYGGLGGINGLQPGPHTVQIDIDLPEGDETPSRLATLDLTTEADVEQTYVLTGTLADHDLVAWSQPARDWSEDQDAEILEVSFGHASASHGTLDFYLGEDDDFDPADATPMATLSYSEMREAVEIPVGDYIAVLTPAGDPSTELLRSNLFTLAAARSIMFVAYDSSALDDTGTPFVALRSIGTGFSGPVPDPNRPTRVRAVNAVTGIPSFDLYIDGDEDEGEEDTLFIPDIPQGSVTEYVALDPLPTVFEIKETDPDVLTSAPLIPATDGTVLLGGPDGEVVGAYFVDDNRAIITHPKFRVLNGSTQFNAIDVYIVPPGGSIEDENPDIRSLVFRAASAYIIAPTGENDVVITEFGSKTVAAGPFPVTFEKGGVYGMAIMNGESDDSLEIIPMDGLAEPVCQQQSQFVCATSR